MVQQLGLLLRQPPINFGQGADLSQTGPEVVAVASTAPSTITISEKPLYVIVPITQVPKPVVVTQPKLVQSTPKPLVTSPRVMQPVPAEMIVLARPFSSVVHSTPVPLSAPQMMSFDSPCLVRDHMKAKSTHEKGIATWIALDGNAETGTAEKSAPQRRVDISKLKSELDEIVKGNINIDFINEYDSSELLFLCKEAVRRAMAAHAIIEELAKEFEVDLTKHLI